MHEWFADSESKRYITWPGQVGFTYEKLPLILLRNRGKHYGVRLPLIGHNIILFLKLWERQVQCRFYLWGNFPVIGHIGRCGWVTKVMFENT